MKMYEIEWKYKIYNTINISFVAGRNTRAAIKSFLDVTKNFSPIIIVGVNKVKDI
jgi:hypothetical protein